MNSLKTAVVVTILLGVMYGVYTTLTNHPGAPPSDSASQWPSVNAQVPGSAGAKGPWATGPNTSGNSPAPNGPPGGATEAPRFVTPGPTKPSATSPLPGSPPGVAAGKTALERSDSLRSGGENLDSRSESRTQGRDGARPGDQEIRPEFRATMQSAQRKLDAGELADVLLRLTPLYGNPELTEAEARQLTDLLDQLAGAVVYSRQHLVEPPRLVRPGETLEQIAEEYRIPWQLLAKINGIRDPNRLTPGKQLKVLHGPFEATICLERYELVLQVGGRYAGRFPIGIGRDQPQLEGTYTIREKLPGRAYSGPEGELAADDPKNPLGHLWIGLNGPLGIHGTDNPRNLRRSDNRGNICLAERDIEDVYDMLSCGSRVTIRR